MRSPAPGAPRNDGLAVVAERGQGVVLVGRGDADDAGIAGREGWRRRAVVAGRGDEDDAVRPGVVDGGLEGRRVAGRAEKAMRMTSAPWSAAQTTPSMMSLSRPRPSAPRTVTGMTETPA